MGPPLGQHLWERVRPDFLQCRFMVIGQTSGHSTDRIRGWALLGGLILLFLAHGLALFFRIQPAVSLWFPPSGVAIALAFWFGPLGIGLAGLTSVILAPLWGSDGWYRLVGLIDMVEPLLAWLLYIKLLRGSLALRGLRNAIAFLLGVPLAAALASALGGCLLLTHLGKIDPETLGEAMAHWWLGNALGILTFTPVALLLGTPLLLRWGWLTGPEGSIPNGFRVAKAHWLEIGLILGSAAGIGWLTVQATETRLLMTLQLSLLGFVPVIWAALRFGLVGAVLTASFRVGVVLLAYLVIYPDAIALPVFPVDPGLLHTHKLSLFLQSAIALLVGSAISERATLQMTLAEEQIRRATYETRAQLGDQLLHLNRLLTEANAQLQASEERFRTSVENMLDSFGIYSALRDEAGRIIDFRIEYVNEAACVSNQRPRQEQIGQRLSQIVPELSSSGLLQDFCQVVETGQPLIREVFFAADPAAPQFASQVFDARVAKYGDGLVATWRNVTERYYAAIELRQRQQEIEALINNSPDIIARLDRDLCHVYVSPAIVAVTGQPPSAFLGKTNPEMGFPESVCRIWESNMRRAFITAQEQRQEFSFWAIDGTVRHYESRLVPELDADGRVASLLTITRDVTSLRQAEAELRRSEELTRTVLENFPNGVVFLFDRDLRFLLAEGSGLDVVGLSRDQLVGKTLAETVQPETAARLTPIYQGALAGQVSRLELCFEGHTYDVRVLPLRNSLGDILAGMAITQDITERKQAEKALQESERSFRTLADVMPQMFWITRADGHHEYFNQRWYVYTGMSPGQGIGDRWQAILHPEDKERTLALWQYCLQSGEPYQIEYRLHQVSDGTYRWHLGRALPLRNQAGQITKWFGSCTDIHDQKLAIEERVQALERERAARQELERANQMKDEFLAIVSHELRSPLNAILGWSRLLRDRRLDAARTEQALASIERNAQAQTQLIEDLLDISRIIRGKVRLNLQPLPLEPIIQAALGTVQPTASTKSIQLTAHCSPQAGLVAGDAERLQQVIWNLLSNAIKFTPEHGQVTISLSPTGSLLRLQVQDTGKGIAPDFLPYIFDRFRQADATTTRSQGGLGLGLAIVRNLVELHGGSVYAESTGVGQGATFTVDLPLLTQERWRYPAQRQAPHRLNPAPSLGGLQVLVVDDEADTRAFLVAALEEFGAIAIATASVQEALTQFQQHPPDVLISDIGMPLEDGYTLIRKIRALPPEAGGQVPAAALTAYVRVDDQERALAAGFQVHLGKPIEPLQLVRAVAQLSRSQPH